MSNMINSTNIPINNTIPARKLSQGTSIRCVQAPQKVPQYSINEELRKKDEFRENIALAQHQQIYGKKKSSFAKICIALAAVTSYFIIKCK